MPHEPRSFRLHEPAGAQFLRVPDGRNCHRRRLCGPRPAALPARQTHGSSCKAVRIKSLRIEPVEHAPRHAAARGSGIRLASITSSIAPQGKARVV